MYQSVKGGIVCWYVRLALHADMYCMSFYAGMSVYQKVQLMLS